jgi:FkbM family methyltransferase
MLGGRSLGFVMRQAAERENYLSLARMSRTCVHPIDFARRYFVGSGSYPARVPVRTPMGVVAPTAYSHHDVWTVNEVFCRLDYRLPPRSRVVVDIGSNIGISALYFLTRSPGVRCYLYEPDPRNAERLEHNLAGYEGRYALVREAVAERTGTVSFGREPTGRYGGIGLAFEDAIEVPCRHINDILADVLASEPQVDLLKLDTEGMEDRTIAAIDHELLARVRVLCYETRAPVNPAPEIFDMAFATETARLTSRAVSAARRMPTGPGGASSVRVGAEHGVQ